MWVLTEGGDLVNLEQAFVVRVNDAQNAVIALGTSANSPVVTLCTCHYEDHGRRIIRKLLEATRHPLAESAGAVDMRGVKCNA